MAPTGPLCPENQSSIELTRSIGLRLVLISGMDTKDKGLLLLSDEIFERGFGNSFVKFRSWEIDCSKDCLECVNHSESKQFISDILVVQGGWLWGESIRSHFNRPINLK